MVHYVHVPAPRRRYSPAGPVDVVLIKLIRASMNRDWTVRDAAADVLDTVEWSPHMLRRVRVKLLTRITTCPSDIGERALATLAVALRQTDRRTTRRRAALN